MPKRRKKDKKSEIEYHGREEIRGLFVLGLLAVLSSIRVQHEEIWVTIGQASFNIIPWLDITITLWSLYAFFMVVGLSGDIIGETTSEISRELSKVFLQFNFVILGLLSSMLAYLAFPTRLPWALVLLSILILYVVIKRLKRPQRKSLKLDFKKMVKSNLLRFLGIAVLFCLVIIVFSSEEQYVFPAFLAGSVITAIYIAIREKTRLE